MAAVRNLMIFTFANRASEGCEFGNLLLVEATGHEGREVSLVLPEAESDTLVGSPIDEQVRVLEPTLLPNGRRH